ncbi:MAG: GAF domain-containing protein [Pseudomonadota bacterium]
MSAPTGLRALCAALVDELDADACVISRVLGDVLIQIAEHVVDGSTLLLGQGWLVSDFPLTAETVEEQRSIRVWTRDPAADPHEKRLLGQLGFEGLLMLPLVVDGATWGLVEAYRRVGAFSADDVAAAERRLERTVAAAAA